jgi:hypothetical protein
VADDVQKRIGRAHPPVRWVHGCACIPLIHDDECRASITVWHHARNWFDDIDRALLVSISRVGGSFFELTELPHKIAAEKDKTLKAALSLTAGQVRAVVFPALAHLAVLGQNKDAPRAQIREIESALNSIESIIRNYREQKDTPEVHLVEGDVAEVIRDVAMRHAVIPELTLKPKVSKALRARAQIDSKALAMAISTLIRTRMARKKTQLTADLALNDVNGFWQIALTDDGPPQPAEIPAGEEDPIQLAKQIADAHHGSLEVASLLNGSRIVIRIPKSKPQGKA